MTKVQNTSSPVLGLTTIPANIPLLIQRGTINRPLGQFRELGIFEAVTFHYAGKPEYDNGILLDSIKDVQHRLKDFQTLKFSQISRRSQGKTFSLWAFGDFKTVDPDAYEDQLVEIHSSSIKTSSMPVPTGFEADGSGFNADFWWDVANNVFFCYDRVFINSLPTLLKHPI